MEKFEKYTPCVFKVLTFGIYSEKDHYLEFTEIAGRKGWVSLGLKHTLGNRGLLLSGSW